MKQLSKSDWLAISGFLLAITFLSLWAIDVSVSALMAEGHLTNGFFNSDPMMMYHIGLYCVGLTCFSNFLIIIHVMFKSYSEKKENKMNPHPHLMEN